MSGTILACKNGLYQPTIVFRKYSNISTEAQSIIANLLSRVQQAPSQSVAIIFRFLLYCFGFCHETWPALRLPAWAMRICQCSKHSPLPLVALSNGTFNVIPAVENWPNLFFTHSTVQITKYGWGAAGDMKPYYNVFRNVVRVRRILYILHHEFAYVEQRIIFL